MFSPLIPKRYLDLFSFSKIYQKHLITWTLLSTMTLCCKSENVFGRLTSLLE